VLKIDKRNTKKRYLVTDGICFRCCTIVNYSYEKRCTICCGSNEFLIGEHGHVLRELLELDIEQVKFACELRGVSGSRSGSRSKLTLDLFKLIFPKLTNIDNRINEFFIQKIIYRNRKRFWYVKDIESIINDIRRQSNERRYKYKVNLKLVDAKDVVEP
jgi:hypothetical protein